MLTATGEACIDSGDETAQARRAGLGHPIDSGGASYRICYRQAAARRISLCVHGMFGNLVPRGPRPQWIYIEKRF
jgi:hypothetical protein